MEKHKCKTYFSVWFKFDFQKNMAFLKERRQSRPEEIGIFNKDEVEKYIVDTFGTVPDWCRHHFVLGNNENYDVDVNEMLRVTLKDFIGK